MSKLSLPAAPVFSWQAHAQLVRLPNVFTALSDIGLGWLCAVAVGAANGRWPSFALLLAASACLYSAGMVWNDFFDVEQDRQERPFRPLPSGRIALHHAVVVGTLLFCLGWLSARAAGLLIAEDHWVIPGLAAILVAMILLYDGWLKRTWMGPLGMGACRFLNVLLGLAPATALVAWGLRVHLAGIVGLYVVGVTWLARTEARASSAAALAGGGSVMLGALVLALPLPLWVEPGESSALFPFLLVLFGFVVGVPVARAIRHPLPSRVQAAVKRAVLGLIALDAILATTIAGGIGLFLLLLLVPALYLGRWIYST
jgi:4-hydroxybenzoate polyprenyltransferase